MKDAENRTGKGTHFGPCWNVGRKTKTRNIESFGDQDRSKTRSGYNERQRGTLRQRGAAVKEETKRQDNEAKAEIKKSAAEKERQRPK